MLTQQQLNLLTPIKLKEGQKRLDAADKLFATYVSRMPQPIESFFNWLTPEGGLAYWVPFHQPVDFGLVRQHLATQGVSLIDTNRFSFEGEPLNALRLGVASLTEAKMEQGISALQLALERL